ncbi:MAG: YHS domain-containing (seleno)protein [Vicinamibacterales bacterium]
MFNTLVRSALVCGLLATASIVAAGAQSGAPAATQAGDVALGGYCPVAYVAMNQAMKGDPSQKSTYKGKTYHFANADAKKMFDAAPDKYVPAYDGWCATAVAQNMKLASDPALFTIHNGRAYLFSDAGAKAMFDKDKTGTIAKADRAWTTLASK